LDSKKSILILVPIVIIIAILGFIYISTPSEETQTKEITLTLAEVSEGEEAWVPQTIHLNKGDNVKLTVVNGDDEFEHRLSIPDLGILTEIIPPANQQIIIDIKFDEVGEFSFNTPSSAVDCTEAPPEEVSRRDLSLNLERQTERLAEAETINEVESVVNQLSGLMIQYGAVAPDDIIEIINQLEEVTTMESVLVLSDELEEAVEEFEGSLSPPCVEPGVIIVSE
tara:strand:+ start:369 stop:1043 length:675 start_codon:yes stop_codon:yes gene_type:complete